MRAISKVWALVAAVGVLVAAAFTLRAIQVSFFGQTGGAPAGPVHLMAPITWPERAGAILLLAATVLIGLKPDLLLNWIVPSLQSPLFQAVWHGGGR